MPVIRGLKPNRESDSISPVTTLSKKQDTCVMCDKLTTEDSLECVWSDRFQHRACVKMSVEKFSALRDLPKNIVFFVLSVSTGSQLHFWPKEVTVKMETKLDSIQETLTNRIDNLTEVLNDLTIKPWWRIGCSERFCNKYWATWPRIAHLAL